MAANFYYIPDNCKFLCIYMVNVMLKFVALCLSTMFDRSLFKFIHTYCLTLNYLLEFVRLVSFQKEKSTNKTVSKHTRCVYKMQIKQGFSIYPGLI